MHTNAVTSISPIKIAVLAMGGQGGGVLADWIVDMAEHAGWWAQTTSVPGVAQRTGATIYYLELLPESVVQQAGRQPALALMPTPGDVDLVVAAELMEGGRAIQRGLVTPERTTLIASSHRSFAVSEKSAPGNGIADSNKVLEAGHVAAQRFICFDLQALADQAGSVISASLFGAVAGSGALPFSRQDFEATIERGGIGVKTSLRAFSAGYEAAATSYVAAASSAHRHDFPALPTHAATPEAQALLERIKRDFPGVAQPLLSAGTQRAAEFQDLAYAREYLDHMATLRALDVQHGGAARDWGLTCAAARYLAVAMAYDDVIRVADLKTRGTRFDRVRAEVGAHADQLIYTTDYMHPRIEEICGTLPTGLGRWLENSPSLSGFVGRCLGKGRRINSSSLTGFLMLYGLAGMRRLRRRTLRHQIEMQALHEWLDLIIELAPHDYALAVEVVNCRRLVKGYSDTHARGTSKYGTLLATARQLAGRTDAAQTLRTLRETALSQVARGPLEDQAKQAIAA